jgi:hypothetical protein
MMAKYLMAALLLGAVAASAQTIWIQDDCYMRYNPDTTTAGRSTLIGYVFDKEHNAPVSGARVALAADFLDSTGRGHTCCCYSATSDANGHYIVHDIAPGYRTLSVIAEGERPEYREITVHADTSLIVNFELSRATVRDSLLPGAVTGRVWDAQGLRPFAGATVTVLENETPVRTDSDGVFLLSNLSPGAHTLKIAAPGYFPQWHPVSITAAMRSEDIVLMPEKLK